MRRRRVAFRARGSQSHEARQLWAHAAECPIRLCVLQNSDLPRGQITNGAMTADILANDQISHASRLSASHRRLSQRHRGPPLRCRRGHRLDAERPHRRLSQRQSRPSVLIIFRQPGANIIDTVDRITAALPRSEASISAGHRRHHRPRPHHHHPRLRQRRRTHPGASPSSSSSCRVHLSA